MGNCRKSLSRVFTIIKMLSISGLVSRHLPRSLQCPDLILNDALLAALGIPSFGKHPWKEAKAWISGRGQKA
ncbi:hypothetical protein V6N12_028424 [Hibiscus sabdariffa]|uniref:Uncharacterized protein n=1 Tax=Hibiscus sabdariffa TaxID=183260 RepID=A0ABR2F5T5_9ROSI